jgi:hypothetical protein
VAHYSTGTAAVVDDDRLLQHLLKRARQYASHDVHGAARRIRNDDLDRTSRVSLRMGDRG